MHVVARLEDDGREENEEEKLLVELYELSELFKASNVFDEDSNDETEDDSASSLRKELAMKLRDGIADDKGDNKNGDQEEECPGKYAALGLTLRFAYMESKRQGLMSGR